MSQELGFGAVNAADNAYRRSTKQLLMKPLKELELELDGLNGIAVV